MSHKCATTSIKVKQVTLYLVDVSVIFYFFRLGEAEGGVRGAGRGGGIGFLLKMPGGGGGFSMTGGAGRVFAANWGNWLGVGPNIFFGAKMSTKYKKPFFSLKVLRRIPFNQKSALN